MTEPIRPSVWRRANRNTALSVRAVVIARDEYCGWPPGVVRGSACQAAIASSENQTVRLPRWRKAASDSAQFGIRRRCFGIRWRRAALAWNGIGGSRVTEGGILLRQPPLHANRPIRATNSHKALCGVRALHDLKPGPRRPTHRPGRLPALVGPIRNHPLQKRKEPSHCPQNTQAAVAVLDVAGQNGAAEH